MWKQRMGVPACCLLVGALSGCGRWESGTSAPRPPAGQATVADAAEPDNPERQEPTLTLGPQCTYDADQPWRPPEEIPPTADERQIADLPVVDEPPVGVVHIGDRLRIYNLAGQWRPATLTLLDEDKNRLETVRLDLPPTGVARVRLASLGGATAASMRLTQPVVERSAPDDRPTPGLLLLDREIGVPAEELTTEIVKQKGWGRMERQIVEGAAAREQADDLPDQPIAAAVHSFGEADVPMTLTTERWEAGVCTSTFSIPTRHWKAVVLGHRASSFASHSGGNGEQPPPETWWARQVEDVFRMMAEQQKTLEDAKAEEASDG